MNVAFVSFIHFKWQAKPILVRPPQHITHTHAHLLTDVGASPSNSFPPPKMTPNTPTQPRRRQMLQSFMGLMNLAEHALVKKYAMGSTERVWNEKLEGWDRVCLCVCGCVCLCVCA
jgi:hypothetical protein